MDETGRQCVIDISKQCLGLKPSDPYFKQLGITSRGPNTHDKGWCGDFVNFCFMKAGVSDCHIINRYDLCGSWEVGMNLARWYAWAEATNSKIDFAQVKPGDVYALKRDDGDHLGIVLSKGDASFTSIDGNSWGGVVAINSRQVDNRIRMFISVDKVPVSDDLAQDKVLTALFTGFKQLAAKWKALLPPSDGGDSSELMKGV